MHAMRSNNLDLTFEDNVAYMTVSGEVSKEAMAEGLDWLETLTGVNDNFNIYVDMAQDDFDGLGEIRQEFVRVGHMLRAVPDTDKCAVVTDSQFLRNSAKIEGAVIPGLEIRVFDRDETKPAEKWLKDESLIEATPKAVQSEAVKPEAETQSDNPWDNFSVKDLDI